MKRTDPDFVDTNALKRTRLVPSDTPVAEPVLLDSTLSAPTLSTRGCNPVNLYKKLNLIEEGSYGLVYRAQHLPSSEIVAVKKIKFEKNSPGFPVTALREITNLLALDHPNIVRYREVVVGKTHRDIYLIMDFVEHDLKALMDHKAKPFAASEIKTLMHQLLSATAHMHARGIMHRDLKTANLLMTNRGMMKVADFGLARQFTPDCDLNTEELTKVVVTLWYRAPELLLGKTDYTASIDMWSIGCIFAELLQNTPFLCGKSEMDQLNLILRHVASLADWPNYKTLPGSRSVKVPKTQPIALKKQFPSASPATHNLLARLLTLNPEDRITAQEALEHDYFLHEFPPMKDPELFMSFPSKGGMEHRRKVGS